MNTNLNTCIFFIYFTDMPAKAMLFDQRLRTLHDFGAAPINTISFNPHGRLVLLAGYGNLAGKTDIYDRRTLNKVCTLDAPNSTHVEWSPDGRFFMTAILSPRLRVDNGVKVWHCSGALVHVQPCEELYQVGWRPVPVDLVPAFPGVVPAAPAPNKSVAEAGVGVGDVPGGGEKTGVAKAQGAYRPPGARGTATPAIFKREDEGGVARTIGGGSGAATPPRVYHNRTPPGAAPGGYHNGNGGYHQQHQHANGGRRHVPGAPPQYQQGQGQGQGGQHPNQQGQDGERKNVKKKKGRKEGGEEGGRTMNGNANGVDAQVVVNPPPSVAVEPGVASPVTPGGLDGSLDPVAKKIRNLTKKVCPAFYFIFDQEFIFCFFC